MTRSHRPPYKGRGAEPLLVPRGTTGDGCSWLVMHHIPHQLPSPHPLTRFCPAAWQINRPPVKLNLLTCQVRPHAEEKKCFDLVTRECHLSVPTRVHLRVPAAGGPWTRGHVDGRELGTERGWVVVMEEGRAVII